MHHQNTSWYQLAHPFIPCQKPCRKQIVLKRSRVHPQAFRASSLPPGPWLRLSKFSVRTHQSLYDHQLIIFTRYKKGHQNQLQPPVQVFSRVELVLLSQILKLNIVNKIHWSHLFYESRHCILALLFLNWEKSGLNLVYSIFIFIS